ncbi:hypothetical protein N0V88_008208 [Collariella sp. IMI 366227]|nr:hypothetical protein N0V88_008208 [Collariella sp. IMI 366227]
MVSLALLLGSLAALYLFLRALLHLTQDTREPPALLTTLPSSNPSWAWSARNPASTPDCATPTPPIYTLRLPFQRMYVVNETSLIPPLQKHWRTVSFAAIAADAGTTVGMSKSAVEVMHRDLNFEHGFSTSWPKYIMSVMAPGKDLDAINRRSIEVFNAEMERLRREGYPIRIGLWEWTRKMILSATTEAVWGPENPYRKPDVASAWTTFEAGFLTLSMFPSPLLASLLFPKLLHAREVAATALISYMHKGGYKTASGLVRKRVEHHAGLFNLSLEDIARGELGNTFAVLGNTTPCALWVLYHILSSPTLLSSIRTELSALITLDPTTNTHTLDLAFLNQSTCPVLLATFQETLRFRAVAPGPRVLLEDVSLNNGRVLLKKGAMLMIPARVQHTDREAWGEDAGRFDHRRFLPSTSNDSNDKRRKINRTAFRPFGGGHVLCPGRHFASTEILSLAALLVLHFDVVPVGNKGMWVEPTYENSPAHAGFPAIDEDIQVELVPRDVGRKWRVVYSGSGGKVMEIVGEDIEAGGRGVV